MRKAQHANRVIPGRALIAPGAKGFKEMHEMPAKTSGQDEERCVVYAMPQKAAKLSCVDKEFTLEHIAYEIPAYASGRIYPA